jgi:beta-glucosidase
MRYFEKVCATPGGADASQTVTYPLTDRDVSNWDIGTKTFTVTSGTYAVYVGASSQDIRLKGSLAV